MSEGNVEELMKRLDIIINRTSAIDKRLTQIENAKSKEQIQSTLSKIENSKQSRQTSTPTSEKASKYLYRRPKPPDSPSYIFTSPQIDEKKASTPKINKTSTNTPKTNKTISETPKTPTQNYISSINPLNSTMSRMETPVYQPSFALPTEYDQTEYTNDFLSEILSIVQDLRSKVADLAEEQIQMREDIKILKQNMK